jgi:hypothetical protein
LLLPVFMFSPSVFPTSSLVFAATTHSTRPTEAPTPGTQLTTHHTRRAWPVILSLQSRSRLNSVIKRRCIRRIVVEIWYQSALTDSTNQRPICSASPARRSRPAAHIRRRFPTSSPYLDTQRAIRLHCQPTRSPLASSKRYLCYCPCRLPQLGLHRGA